MYGPGDSATWPACTGHPNDPRTDTLAISRAMDEARAMANDPEAVANSLNAGVRAVTAAYIADALHLLKEGRHDEADAMARLAENALAIEYLAANEPRAA